jgi:transcriptional regulator with XRE-family HTH domain
MGFAERLDEELRILDATNADLAAASGLGKSTVSRYRRGEREPRWGSTQLRQLAGGLCRLHQGRGREVPEEKAVLDGLNASLSGGLRLDYDISLSRIKLLCRALELHSASLARALSYDPSYISRILSGVRRPGDAAGFAAQVAACAARLCAAGERRHAVAELVGCAPDILASRETGEEALRIWLTEG